METKVTRHGQITLAKEIRDELEIMVGTSLKVYKMGDEIVLRKKTPEFWDRCGGALPRSFDYRELRKDSAKRYRRLYG